MATIDFTDGPRSSRARPADGTCDHRRLRHRRRERRGDDLTDAGADDLLAACSGGPGSVTFVAGDVAVADEIAAVIGEAIERHGHLDGAVNAAAIEFEPCRSPTAPTTTSIG